MLRRLILLLVIVGYKDPKDVYGCTVEAACNFNADVNIVDDSCWYANKVCECINGEEAVADNCGLSIGYGTICFVTDINRNIYQTVMIGGQL